MRSGLLLVAARAASAAALLGWLLLSSRGAWLLAALRCHARAGRAWGEVGRSIFLGLDMPGAAAARFGPPLTRITERECASCHQVLLATAWATLES